MSDARLTSDPQCAHGRLAYERCRDCEDSYHAGTGRGFDMPEQPTSDQSALTMQVGLGLARYKHEFQKASGSREMVEHEDGDWVRHEDVHCMANEIERLTLCLGTANHNHEHFEREWYLRGDEIERLERRIVELGKCLYDEQHGITANTRTTEPPAAPQWISVNDRLPIDGTEVLYVFNGQWWPGKYLGCDNEDSLPCFGGKYGFLTGDVTYWMPIPALPGAPSTKGPYLAKQIAQDRKPTLCNGDATKDCTDHDDFNYCWNCKTSRGQRRAS